MGTRRARAALALLATAVVATACAQDATAPGPRPGVDPSFVHGTDGGDIDRIAAATVTDVQHYWAGEFPKDFSAPWRDLDGGAYSVDTTNVDSVSPPCSGSSQEIEGNAYYCGSVDAIAWDRSALLPVLREHYGDTAITAVLAHEMGHAVQQRSGHDSEDRSMRTEAMADCYAGSFVRWVADGHAEHLHTDPAQLDSALRALITFRDPVGSTQSATNAHGSAFDRVAAFQDGYRAGPPRCATVGDETAKLTGPEAGASEAGAAEDRTGAGPQGAGPRGSGSQSGGHQGGGHQGGGSQGGGSQGGAGREAAEPVRAFFARFAGERGATGWAPPPLRWSPAGGSRPATRPDCPVADAPAAYCSRPPAVVADRAALEALRRDAGEQAPETLLASRYAVAAQSALRLPVAGAVAGRRTTCLTGAYTGSLRSSDSPLAADDLDSAVTSLLNSDGVSRDATGANAISGFDRVAEFRKGLVGGSGVCG